jgi:2-keto-4-pentenoate hydratase
VGARGIELLQGHVILPGSITASIPVRGGDTVTAMFAGLGSVTARFCGGLLGVVPPGEHSAEDR